MPFSGELGKRVALENGQTAATLRRYCGATVNARHSQEDQHHQGRWRKRLSPRQREAAYTTSGGVPKGRRCTSWYESISRPSWPKLSLRPGGLPEFVKEEFGAFLECGIQTKRPDPRPNPDSIRFSSLSRQPPLARTRERRQRPKP
jgi:hypothetical protein